MCKGRELHIPHLHEWQRACLQMGNGGGRMGWGAWCYAFSLRGFMPFRSLNTNVNSTSTHRA